MEIQAVRARVHTSISRSPKLPVLFPKLYGNQVNVLYFLTAAMLNSYNFLQSGKIVFMCLYHQ